MSKRPSAVKTTAFGIILILLQIGLQKGLIYILPLLKEKYNITLSMALAIPTLFTLVIPTILYFVITRANIVETLKLNPISLKTAIKLILFGLCIQPLAILISTLSSLISPNIVTQSLSTMNDNLSFPMLVYFSCISPAIFEEITTRGVVLSGYKGKPIVIAAIVNGLIFAILHMNFQQGAYAFVLGYIFVYLVNASESILGSMIVHFVVNFYQVCLLKVALSVPQSSIPSEPAPITIQTILPILFMACVFTPICYLIYKSIKRERQKFFVDRSGNLLV